MDLVTVETNYGRLRGEAEAGVVTFRGIPYAAPPLGDLRFRPAQPMASWAGVREATSFAPMSIQPPPQPAGTIVGDPTEESEDCLYLNIYTPSCDGSRPVMVFIHGGGFVGGTASSGLYRGDFLAGEGVVLVTVNYRLGALGWLGHPGLSHPDDAPGCANWGLSDQLAALEWVKENIGAFGGDSERVTLFGESAGAMSVAALMATSAAGRLFQRAIVESGAAAVHGQGTAEKVTEELAGELGLAEVTREAIVALPATEILRAQLATGLKFPRIGLMFQPVIDGGLLSEHPAAAIAGGSANSLDVIVGTNRDEWRFWALSDPSLREIGEERLSRLVSRQLADAGLDGVLDPSATIETYRDARSGRGDATTPTDIYSAFASDWTFRVPSTRLTAGHRGGFQRAYSYLFDWESPLFGGLLGSCHALELPFVFGSCNNPSVAVFSGGGPDAEKLSAAVRAAWARFAENGDPSGGELGGWPQYETTRRATKRLGAVIETVDAPMETERAWLDDALGPFGEIEAADAKRVRLPSSRS